MHIFCETCLDLTEHIEFLSMFFECQMCGEIKDSAEIEDKLEDRFRKEISDERITNKK